MNLIKKVFIILIFLMISCWRPQPKKTTDITFSDYLKSLDTIHLPFTDFSLPTLNKLSKKFDTAGFIKYGLSDCTKPLGIYPNNSYSQVVIYMLDSIHMYYPILVSYDKSGHKLDTLYLYADTAARLSPDFKLYKRNKIVVVDSIRYWAHTSSSKDILTAKVDSAIFDLSENGKFIKEKQKK